MRLLVTIALALVLSGLGGSAAAMLAAKWANGDESYILAFMAVPLASLVGVVVFLVASTRATPAQSIDGAALGMVGLLVLAFAALSVFELFVNGTIAAAWRGVQLHVGIFGGCSVVAIVQWVVFRWRLRQAASSVLFGRGTGALP